MFYVLWKEKSTGLDLANYSVHSQSTSPFLEKKNEQKQVEAVCKENLHSFMIYPSWYYVSSPRNSILDDCIIEPTVQICYKYL